MSIKQDKGHLSRTPLDTERKYNQKIKRTSEKVEQLEEENEVDSALSASSTNAVENRVITEALSHKVNAVDGKQLSTNDFTNGYKKMLDELDISGLESAHTHNNKEILDGISSTSIEQWSNLALYENGGTTDADTTVAPLTLTKVSTPTTDFWYVQTLFYNKVADTSNRKQIAYAYKFDAPIYTRHYINGVWSEWTIGGKKSYDLANYKASGLTLLRGTCVVKDKRAVINYAGTISIAANTTTVLFNLPAELAPKEIKDFVVFGQNTNNDGYIGYGQISTEGTLQVRFNTAISSYTRFSLTYDLD